MFDNEYTEDEIYYQESMKLVNEIELNKDSISSLNKDEILFIMSCNECIDFLDIHKNYYSYNLYKKELSEETIKELHFEDYDAINLGLGHALVIRKDIYNEFMKILKNEIIYEDEFNPDHVYAAWNHWVGCAIKLIDKKSNSILSIKFEKILERDVDLMIINQISFNKSFLILFLDKISKKNYIVESIEHSLMDQEDGESDITVILSNGINKIALLIEDKIDAHAMPMQPERYIKRGKKGIENKQYDEFYDFLVAPQEYLESNMEAKQYTYRVSYEEMQAKQILNNSFVYCDPPYLPDDLLVYQKQMLYTKEAFNHELFFELINKLKIKNIMISISESSVADKIYNNHPFKKIDIMEIIRVINPKKLFSSKEIAFINYNFKE